MKSAIIDYECVDGFKFEVTLNKTQILVNRQDLKERGFSTYVFSISMAICRYIQPRNPPKVSESIRFGNCSGITNPRWTLLSDDLESIAISFLADDCGFIVETEPNIIYQSTLFIPNSGNFFNQSFKK